MKYVELKNGFAVENGFVKIYQYHTVTKEFLGSTDEYLMIGTGIPASSTVIATPKFEKGFIPIFNETEKCWNLLEDHRGEKVYNKTTGKEEIVVNMGKIDGYTKIQPTTPFDEWNTESNTWVTNTEKQSISKQAELEKTKQNLKNIALSKITELNFAVELNIATKSELLLLSKLKAYVVALNRLDLTLENIEWPDLPQ
jgi:hypothetical protein